MTTPQLEFDRELLGKEFPAGTFRVEKERLLAYCAAIGESNPIYTDEEAARRSGFRSLVAPPSFCTLLERTSIRPKIHLKFSGMAFHAWQTIECFAPVCAGDVLEARARLKDVYTRPGRTGPAAVVVWETTFTNQEATLVALVQASSITRPRPADGGTRPRLEGGGA